MKSYIISISFIAAAIFLLSGCQNTAKGFGEDMQSNGKAIQKSINDN
jgi:predicted small secreted protein